MVGKIQSIVVVIVFFLFFLKGGLGGLGPDFGWHLRMGKLILNQGIPKTDPFSYTMPSFAYVDHEWMINVLIAISYSQTKETGLSFFSAVLAISALLIGIGRKWYMWTIIPFLLGVASIFGAGGVRPQIITLFFLSVFLAIILNKNNWKKRRWILPFLLVFWTNLHGGFAAGLFVIFFSILAKIVESKKIEPFNILLLALSVIATFVNPYGIEIWREVWMSMSDSNLRWSISEWIPSVFTLSLSQSCLLAFSGFFVVQYWKKFSPTHLLIYVVLLILGLSSIRHFALWTVIAFPMLNTSINYLKLEAKLMDKSLVRFNRIRSVLTILIIVLFSIDMTFMFYSQLSYKEGTFYPKNAIEFLKKNPSSGQVFSTYNWGGYLIWKLPEKKVFVDGRMPSWRWEKFPEKESGYAFRDYNDVMKGKVPLSLVMQKYGIDTLLLPVQSEKKNIVFLLENYLEERSLPFRKKEKNKTTLASQIKKIGMKEIYKDPTAIIYRKQ